MTRLEFSATIKGFRTNNTTVSLNEVWRRTNFAPSQTIRIEKGENNYNMHNLTLYMSAIEAHVVLVKGRKCVKIESYDDIVAWAIKSRGTQFTKYSLAKEINCSQSVIGNMESKKCTISIDLFLKLVDVFGYRIEIRPNK